MTGTILNALPILAHLILITVPRGAFHGHPHLINEHIGKLDTREGGGGCPNQ